MQLKALSTINSPSGRGNDALGVLLQESPFLRFLEENSGWEEDATNYDFLPTPYDLLTIEERTAGNSYTAAAVSPNSRQTGSLYFQGASIDIDISYLADAQRGLRDIPTWFTKELRSRMKQFSVGYEKLLFQGTGVDGQIKGLKTIIAGSDIPGYTGTTCLENAQEVTAGSTKSCDISSSTNFAKFMEWLWKKINSIDRPMGLVMNRALYARMWTIARKEQVLSETRDMFGMPIAKYNGIPMIPVLDTTILNTEPDDTGTPVNETTSLYIMSPGEQRLSLVSNSGLYWMDYDHLENNEQGREKWEIRAAWKIEEPLAISRIRNIKL